MKWKRGQAVVTDLFVAIAVFVILVTIISLSWDLYQIRFIKKIEYDDMILRTFHASDSLIKSKGIPTNWNHLYPPTLPQELGLVNLERTIDDKKLAKFRNMSGNDIENILKIKPYKFYWVLKNETGAILITHGTPPSGKLNVNVARLVIYKGKPSAMELSIWKPLNITA